MSNSRMNLRTDDEKPHNSSKGKGLILETPYKPGFIDDSDLETVKMAVDKELDDISNAFYQTTERTADTITRVDKIEIETDGIGAKIEEVDKVSKERDEALAQRITTISAQVGDNTAMITSETTARVTADEAIGQRIDSIIGAFGGELGPLFAEIDNNFKVLSKADEALAQRIETTKAEYEAADTLIKADIVTETTARVTADQALASEITTVGTQLGDDIAAVQQYASTEISKVEGEVNKINAKWGVEVDVNGKISGIALNNNGARSNFEVRADSFKFTDTSGGVSGGFESSGGVTKFSGELSAARGSFAGDISASYGTFTGGLSIADQGGNVGMKISNSQILIYDEYGRLRVRLGRLA